MRCDLLDTFKILRGFENYGQNLFIVSRSGLNLVSRGNKVSRSRQDFLSERVISYWNNLPNHVNLSRLVLIALNVAWKHIFHFYFHSYLKSNNSLRFLKRFYHFGSIVSERAFSCQ